LGLIIKNPTDFFLGLVLALVFALDIATTQICLSSGIGYELNPFMRAIVNDPLLVILAKCVALILTIWFVNKFKDAFPEWIGHFGMSVVIGITFGAVVNNLMVIL
jgi:hypothetical protein